MSNPIKALVLVSALGAAGLAMSVAAMAQPMGRGGDETVREEVRVPLAVEGWVGTETARVDVVGDLTLVSGDRAKARAQALGALAGVVPGTEWRVIRFSRRTDTTGAERWSFDAFARLKQNVIDGLKAKLDALKKPGFAYRISSIRMTPTLAEIEAARARLRRQIYGLARLEAANAQALWPGRKVRVMQIDFAPPAATPRPRIQRLQAALGQTAADAPVAAPMAVEQHLQVSAVVTLMPEQRSGGER